MGFLSNLRDKAVESFVRNNEFVRKFGDIQSISIDSENGSADVDILLHGEKESLHFKGYYFFDTADNGGTDLVIRKITCEREWINDVLDLWLGKTTLRYTIPGLAGGIAKIVF